MRFDLLIKGGIVVDDPSGLSGRRDVAITKDRIAAVEADGYLREQSIGMEKKDERAYPLCLGDEQPG